MYKTAETLTEDGVDAILAHAEDVLKNPGPTDPYNQGMYDGFVACLECLLSIHERPADEILAAHLDGSYQNAD